MSKKSKIDKFMRKNLESEVGRLLLRGQIIEAGLLTLPPEDRELARNNTEEMGNMVNFANARVEVMVEAMEEKDRLTKAAGGSLKTCGGEECRKKGRKRCTGCYIMLYCSKECQETDWSRHKVECKEVRKEFKSVVLKKGFMPPTHPCYTPTMNTMAKGHCVVEIHEIKMETVYLVEGENWKKGDLLVANMDGTIKSHMARVGQEEVFDTILKGCREKGFKGRAGFYMAVVEANEEVIKLKVNPARMLPAESWVSFFPE